MVGPVQHKIIFYSTTSNTKWKSNIIKEPNSYNQRFEVNLSSWSSVLLKPSPNLWKQDHIKFWSNLVARTTDVVDFWWKTETKLYRVHQRVAKKSWRGVRDTRSKLLESKTIIKLKNFGFYIYRDLDDRGFFYFSCFFLTEEGAKHWMMRRFESWCFSKVGMPGMRWLLLGTRPKSPTCVKEREKGIIEHL